jgi:hypothetical protein
MKTFEQRLVMILADPDLSDSQFRAAAHFLASGRIHRVIRAAEELRSHLRHLFRGEDDMDSEFYERLKGILLRDANMKSTDALRALARELDFDRPFPAKGSFRHGLAHLLENGSTSALLSAAERIRERRSNSKSEHGWPLIQGKSESENTSD